MYIYYIYIYIRIYIYLLQSRCNECSYTTSNAYYYVVKQIRYTKLLKSDSDLPKKLFSLLQ